MAASRAWVSALVACACAGAAPSPPLAAGYAQLRSQFNATSGCWGADCKTFLWLSANEAHSAANFYALSPSADGAALLRAAFLSLEQQVCDCWRDDQSWLMLSWLRAAAVTGDTDYVVAAQRVFSDLVGPWRAWNESCGGVMWENGVPYRNAITNELFLTASMRLHNATAGTALDPGPVSGLTYLQWAQREWAWFAASAMYPVSVAGVVPDGLSSENCSLAALAPGAGNWTYNSGVLLDGLVLLGDATGDAALAAFAMRLARAAAAYFSAAGDVSHVLRELGCGRPAGDCSGGKDGQLFKGMFVRHLGYAAALLAARQPDFAAWAHAYLGNQSASIVASNAVAPAPGRLAFGVLWQGPYKADAAEPWVAQGAALDALLAHELLAQALAPS